MEQVCLSKTTKLGVILIGALIIAWLLGSTVCNMFAAILYKTATIERKPTVRLIMPGYYQKAFLNIDKAIFFNSSNAKYYAEKANYYSKALRDGLGSELNIYTVDAERAYNKAIRLNPTNFSYWKKYAAFYIGENDLLFESKMKMAIKACPACYGPYGELANYYFMRGDEQKAGFWLMEMIAKGRNHYVGGFHRILQLVRNKYADDLETISFYDKDYRKQALIYTFYPNDSVFDFGKKGLAHVFTPLRIKVYAQEESLGVTVYNKYTVYARMTKKGTTNGFFYEKKINTLESKIFPDDLRVESDSGALIDKVEVIIAVRHSIHE